MFSFLILDNDLRLWCHWRRRRRCGRDVMIRREDAQFEFGALRAVAGAVAGNSRSAAFGQ
jgi:hypothetical protein